MAIYSASFSGNIPSSPFPLAALYQPASPTHLIKLRSVEVINETATVITELGLRRMTALGGGGSQTFAVALPHDTNDQAASGLLAQLTVVGPTIATGSLIKFPVSAAIGAAYIFRWPSGSEPIIPLTANNGLLIVITAGSGTTCVMNAEWEEVA